MNSCFLVIKEFKGTGGKVRTEFWLRENSPKGTKIPIYYDPENPERIVLQEGAISPGRIFLYGGVSLLLCIGGAIMLIAYFWPSTILSPSSPPGETSQEEHMT